MPRLHLDIAGHLTEGELKAKYIACEHLVERSHYQIIWLMKRKQKPLTAEEVADIMGCTPDWIRKVVRRYNQEGEGSLQDKRKMNGNEPLLSPEELQKLEEALTGRPADQGLWTGPKVAQWLSAKKNGRKVSAVTGWNYLSRLEMSLQTPRKRHRDSASTEEREAFKKNFKRKFRSKEVSIQQKP
jgi:transposase